MCRSNPAWKLGRPNLGHGSNSHTTCIGCGIPLEVPQPTRPLCRDCRYWSRIGQQIEEINRLLHEVGL